MLEQSGKYNSKIKRELLDMDYVHLLDDTEKQFLNNFLEETVNTNFKHEGKKFIKSKKKQLEIYNENNARNRCLYNIAKVTGRLDCEIEDGDQRKDLIEDLLISEIDKSLKDED